MSDSEQEAVCSRIEQAEFNAGVDELCDLLFDWVGRGEISFIQLQVFFPGKGRSNA